jgi:hypothetical protein
MLAPAAAALAPAPRARLLIRSAGTSTFARPLVGTLVCPTQGAPTAVRAARRRGSTAMTCRSNGGTADSPPECVAPHESSDADSGLDVAAAAYASLVPEGGDSHPEFEQCVASNEPLGSGGADEVAAAYAALVSQGSKAGGC